MPQRNGQGSNRGRSAIARRAINTNSTNGMMPQLACKLTDERGNPLMYKDKNGNLVQREVRPCGYFGGPKKGGSAPSATGFMVPKSTGYKSHSSNYQSGRNYLFKSHTGAGNSPYQVGAPRL